MIDRKELKILESTIASEIEEYRKDIENCDETTQATSAFLEHELCGSIESGYGLFIESISKTLPNQGKSLSKLERSKAHFNWKSSHVTEQDKAQQVLLEEIVGMLHIPDIEKERKLFIEKGLNFFKKASSNVEFYTHSKKFYEKALSYDDLDYYVLYNLGLIHLFAKEYTDFEQAAKYFAKSALFAETELNHKELSYSNYNSIFHSAINPISITVNAFTYQARCLFIIGNKQNVLETINKAIEINPKDTSALFDKLKYLVAFKQFGKVNSILTDIIEIDHYIVLRILKEIELIKVEEISSFLIQLKTTTCAKAHSQIRKCQSIINEKSTLYKSLLNAESYLQKGNYLAAMEALKILNQTQ